VLSEAILQMQESGEISLMKTKWWKEKRGGGACGVSSLFGMKQLFMFIQKCKSFTKGLLNGFDVMKVCC